MRESPAVKLIELLRNAGADVSYHDPHVPSFAEHGLAMSSVPFEPAAYHAVVIATAHTWIDYVELVEDARWSSTSATRPAGPAFVSERSGSCDPDRSRRGRRVGQERRPGRRRDRRPGLDRRHRPDRRATFGARYPLPA